MIEGVTHTTKDGRLKRNTPSWKEIGSGGAKFGEKLKDNSEALYRIITDDAEFKLAMFLGRSGKLLRIGACTGVSRRGKRQVPKFSVLLIDETRIKEMARLG